MYKGDPVRLSTDFSAETLQVRKEQDNVFEVWKEKKLTKNTISGKTVSQK